MEAHLPSQLTAGETFRASITAQADSVTVYLRGPAAYNATATLDAGVWKISASTASWQAGTYAVEAWGTNVVVCGETVPSYVIARGRLDVALSAQVGGSGFSALNTYEQIVQAIESHLASAGQDPTWRRYKINNRELERYGAGELLQLLGHYKRLAAIQRRKQKGQSVLGPNVRFRL